MKKLNRLGNESQRGAITLYILIVCLFFTFVLVSIYIRNVNRMQSQEEEVRQIERNYKQQLEYADEIFEELSQGLRATLSQSPENGTWTKEVTLTGTANNTGNDKVNIVAYTFSKDSTVEENLNWIDIAKVTETTQTTKVTENGTYYFWVKDENGNIYKSNEVKVENIDRTAPTPGTITAKEESNEGPEYKFNTWTNKDVYVEKVDGKDQEPGSGHKRTTITILKNGVKVDEWTNIEGPVTLTESGIYTVTVTTEDNAGNQATGEPYIIKIDKIVPELALKHIDVNGENYEFGTWTRDNLYGEITIDTTSTGKTVEKYQYSENGIVWDDISAEAVEKELDYTSTFPLYEDKPEWLVGPTVGTTTSDFSITENGTIEPNNGHSSGNTNANTTARSYFEIDLTNYPDAKLEVTLNTTISSETNYDIGFAEITESETTPAFNKNNTYFINTKGTTGTKDYTTTITGGKKYYLHLAYSKDGSSSSGNDTFIINSIKLKSEELGKGINFYNYNKENNKVTFTLQDHLEKIIYIRAVYGKNDYSQKSNEYSIKIDKKAPTITVASSSISSPTTAQANVTIEEDGSGLKGYYLSTEETAPTESSNWTEQTLKQFTINDLKPGTVYYIWAIDNVGNISEKTQIELGTVNYEVDGNKYTETLAEAISKASDGSTIKLLNDYNDESTATFSKNIKFDIQNYTLTRSLTITVNSGKTLEINGTGKITSGTNNVNTITNNGTLTIGGEVTIESRTTNSSYGAIRNNSSSAVININDNVKITGNYKGVYNYYGTLNLNGGTIEAIYNGSSGYGIYNYQSSAKSYIKNGLVTGYYGIYQSSGTVEMTGGKVVGTGASGIQNGTTNVFGGRIEGKTYGIYANATNRVTIGREEDELSTTVPAIYGATYGIYMSNASYIFNFYNGVIISNTEETAYRGELNPRTGYMPFTYLDYEVEQRYCTILVPTVDHITMTATPTEFTNGNVTVRIVYPYVVGETREYSEDGQTWKSTNLYGLDVIVTENKIIYARTLNESGMVTDEEQITVDNIDKEKPTAEITPTKTKYTVVETDGTVDLNIQITASDTGVSGLDKMQYAWAKEGETVTYKDFDRTVTINNDKLEIGTYYLYVNITDKAGNVCDITQIRYIVEYQEPVAQIGDTKYLTIQDAVEACSKTAGEEQTTILILKDTDEEFSTYEGQNIILELDGHTIGSSSPDTPICTNNGTLQIIDTSTEQTGKIESLNGTVITNNGTLTIGDNSTEIDMDVPTIYGKKVGIDNNKYFNFYDGKIQGTSPISGNVTGTPENYGPVSTDYNNGITTVQLGIVSGYEARIEWVYYTRVQDAVNATDPLNKETVTIIKNIQMNDTLDIPITKDFILDLNGFELTIADGKETVISNFGGLEIADSSEERTGTISITLVKTGTSNNSIKTIAINNEGKEKLKISGGSIIVNSDGNYNKSYGIFNNSNGNIEMVGGKIFCSGTSYGIYNNDSGTIEINGGYISSDRKKTSYGIYNSQDGKVIMKNGEIYLEQDRNIAKISTYCIYNSNGKVEMLGGKNNGVYGIYNMNEGIITIHDGFIEASGVNSSDTAISRGIYNTGTGKVIINGGTIDTSSYSIYNQNEGYIEINGGLISSNVYGVYNYSEKGTVVMNDGEISNDSCSGGIYNNGLLEMKGGIIKVKATYTYRKVNGIYNRGRLILGDKDVPVSQDDLIVLAYGKYYPCAIENNGLMEFYNGIVQSEDNQTIFGMVSNVREGFKIENSTIDGYDSIYLVEDVNTDYIAQIDNVKYTKLSEAIDATNNQEEVTIKILKDFQLNEAITFKNNIILDFNGHIINNLCYEISNIGNLKIIDSSIEKTGKLVFDISKNGIINKEVGEIKFSSGTIESRGPGYNFDCYAIYNEGTGQIEIDGGNILMNSYDHSYGIYLKQASKFILKEGNIETYGNNGGYGIYNNASGSEIQVWGGTIASGGYGIYNVQNGEIKIYDGNIKGSDYAVYSSSNLEMINGTIEGGSGISTYGNSKIKGGSINITDFYEAYGINNRGGTLEVTGVNISIKSSSRNSYGIYNSGTLILGTKGDGLVSQEEPNIKSEYTGTSTSYGAYGVYNKTGKFYFYDGIIQGSTKAVEDTITEYEEETELNWQENDTILTLSTTLTDVAQIGEITYPTLEEAINAAGTNQTTIKILRNIMCQNTEAIKVIPSDKNIIIDLDGHQITSSIENGVIENNGILEIIDTNEDKRGKIISATERLIKNNSSGILTISDITIENRENIPIENTGVLKIKSGTIDSSDSWSDYYGILNDENGILEISGGTIIGGYGIYNNSINKIVMSSGTVLGDYYGIYNNTTGTILITGGTISEERHISSSYQCVYNNSTGIIQIGEKDGEISQTSPLLQTTRTGGGIYNTIGTVNFYDGKIQGATRGISGNITDVEDLAEIIITTETVSDKDLETLTLQTKTSNVASLNGVEYDSIEEAIKAAGTTESTIQILRDSDPGATIIIEEGQSITLDLNGFTTVNYTELQNNGTLKIIDTSAGQNGKITGLIGTAIKNAGTLELNGGTVSDTGYAINNTGTVNITGGKLTGNTYGVYNSNSNAIINMTDGEISSNTYGLYNYNSGTINVNGGTITSNTYGIYSSAGTTNISSTGISANDYGVYNAGGTVNVKEGATISSNIGIYNTKGTVNIGEKGRVNDETPEIIGEEYGLVNQATVNMYDGQIRGKTGSTQGYVTNTETGYEVETIVDGEYMVDHLALSGTVSEVAEVNGISFSNLQSAINSAIGEEAVTVKLKNGITGSQTFTIAEGQNIILDMNEKTIASDQPVTIINNGTLTIIDSTLSGVGKISSTTGVAIENNGTLALGEDDGTVRQDLITIEGETNGIVTSGTLNFYDGTINGASAVSGTVTARPDGYVIRTTTVNGKERYYLSAS